MRIAEVLLLFRALMSARARVPPVVWDLRLEELAFLASLDRRPREKVSSTSRLALGTKTDLTAGRIHMQGFIAQFEIHDSFLEVGCRLFTLASDRNFIQGRRIDMVAAVCLYTACRSEKKIPCRVMLIDFADRLGVSPPTHDCR